VATIAEVRLIFEETLIARHQRDWGREQTRFNPIHYLSLLERKPGGFDHARPLEDWDLPVCLGILRRRLKAELQSAGTREFIKVLRLLERHPIPTLKRAVEHALAIDATRASAIRLILEYQQESPLTLFSLEGRNWNTHFSVSGRRLDTAVIVSGHQARELAQKCRECRDKQQ